MNFTKSAIFVISATTLLAPLSVHALEIDVKNEQQVVVRDLKEQLREAISTRVGDLKKLMKSRVFLNDATITAVSENSLTVTSEGQTYTVNLRSDTKVRRHYYGKSELSEFQVGQHVNVWGTFTDETRTTISAAFVRNLSIMKRHGVFIGIVKAISDNMLTLDTIARGVQKVTVDANTIFVNRKMEGISQSDVEVGHRIRVKGMWDKTNSTVTEVKQVKDFTLPQVEGKTNDAVAPTVSVTSTIKVAPTVTLTLTPTP